MLHWFYIKFRNWLSGIDDQWDWIHHVQNPIKCPNSPDPRCSRFGVWDEMCAYVTQGKPPKRLWQASGQRWHLMGFGNVSDPGLLIITHGISFLSWYILESVEQYQKKIIILWACFNSSMRQSHLGTERNAPVIPNCFQPCQCCCHLCSPGEHLRLGTLVGYNWAQVPEACELWILSAELQRIQAMEITCCCKILCISYEDHVINEEVHAQIQQAVGCPEDLLTIVKRCKLN